jgi:phosphoserine aminotransferase
MVGLRTLAPFGIGEYLRASLYNGVTLEQATKLVEFMKQFACDKCITNLNSIIIHIVN